MSFDKVLVARFGGAVWCHVSCHVLHCRVVSCRFMPCRFVSDRFLFIVGLELDPGLLKSNAKKASILSITGQAVTWVLSLGVSRAMITW